jgi:two-component system, cell cycle sensor histidine kinase and response regulator CckA
MNIVKRPSVEDALRASEERLRYFVDHAQDIIYYCDIDGRFTYVNPTAARIMKYDEGELLGRHFITLIRRDDRARAGELYTRQMSERTPNTYFEFAAVTKDGDTIWLGQHVQLVHDGNAIVGVQAIARDITRQKAVEAQLRQSEARYRSLIQGAAYGIYRTTIDGRILDANPALATLLGYGSADELMALNMSAVYLVPADRTQLIERSRAGGIGAPGVDVNWKRKDGTVIIVRITARVVDLEDGVSCFEGIVEDITAKRAFEEQLRQAQKMEAVGRLARGVAHDFNNVLAAILGCAELLAKRLAEGDPSRQDAEEIQKAAGRGANLTRQLLAFSRRQPLEPQRLNLHEIVRGVDSMLARLSEHIELRIHTPGDPPFVRVEPGQIEQVLLNLVVNARDAMPDGGTIDVTVRAVTLDDRAVAAYPGMQPGSYGLITVRDTGVGIAPDMQRHVFEPFFSSKDPAKGSGLGLSIVYGIAREGGGTVTFSTEAEGPSRGTTFHVLLPLEV